MIAAEGSKLHKNGQWQFEDNNALKEVSLTNFQWTQIIIEGNEFSAEKHEKYSLKISDPIFAIFWVKIVKITWQF